MPSLLNQFRKKLQLPEHFSVMDVVASLRTRPVPIETFSVSSRPPRSELSLVGQLATNQNGASFVKWWQYFDSYSRELDGLTRDRKENPNQKPLHILEIGVWRGGSLGLWREYFGPEAVIFGIDIDPESAKCDGLHGQVRIGSQGDPLFLDSVVREMGGLDVVIDDGSHESRDVVTTLRHLWPQLSDGGLYFIEDLHTSYWPAWGGGLKRPSSSIEALKTLIDVIHQPYFHCNADSYQLGISRDELFAITFYDSVAVLLKRQTPGPRPFRGGGDN